MCVKLLTFIFTNIIYKYNNKNRKTHCKKILLDMHLLNIEILVLVTSNKSMVKDIII